MTGPPAARPMSTSPGAAGLIGEVYEVRWPDGRRFDSRRRVSAHEAQLLVDGGICAEVRSPSGLLRYLKLKRNPPLKRFASILAQADFTTTTAGILHQHTESMKRGL
jgi:hypothetical protein